VTGVEAFLVRLLGRLPNALAVRLSGEPPLRIDGQRLDATCQLLRARRRTHSPSGLTGPTLEAARARYERDLLVLGGGRTDVWKVRALEVD
jgi:hypothetical protein